MNGPRPAIISFDLDGTLVDTASEIAEAANLALRDIGLAPQPDATVEKLIGAGTRELMLRLLRIAGDGGAPSPTPGGPTPKADDALARFAFHYAAVAGSRCRP